MEYLEQKQFADPQDLADFVNENDIRVVSISESYGAWHLFFRKNL